MREPVFSFEGPEGVKVEVFDESSTYAYQNIFYVKLRVEGTFAGSGEKFARTLEKMGVFAEDLEATKAALIDSFKATALPYLLKSGFASRLKEAKEAEKSRKKGVGGYRS